jgi:hypothetical protein
MQKSNYEVPKEHIYNWMKKNEEKYKQYSHQKGLLLFYEKHKAELLKKQKQDNEKSPNEI